MFPNYPFYVCLHYHPFSIISTTFKVLVAKLARYEDWRGRKTKEGARRALYRQHSEIQLGKTTTAWLAQYDISPGEGNFTWNFRANIDRDRLTIEVIHYWALIMVPLMEPPESLSESPSTPLGFGGGGMTVNDVCDDCEDEWLLAEPSLGRREHAET